MSKGKKEDSSSSEDEVCIEALKEAADQEFLKNSYFNNEKSTERDLKLNKIEKKDKNESKDKIDVDNSHEFENHGLSQSCRDFIAKKLRERLEGEIMLDDRDTVKRKIENETEESRGIKLLSSSNIVLTNIKDTVEPTILIKKRKPNCEYDEKKHLKKCKEVVVDPEKIISKHETQFWTDRKIREPFKYKKLKNGTLVEIK